MRNDTRHMKGYALSNSNYRPIIETIKAKDELYKTIKQFVNKLQTKTSQTRSINRRTSKNVRRVNL
jgi:hypothetical protein